MPTACCDAPAPRWMARFAIGLTFFNSWVLFEETIVDRHGLWAYLPFYGVGQLCAWDVGAAVVIAAGLWRLGRRRRAAPAPH